MKAAVERFLAPLAAQTMRRLFKLPISNPAKAAIWNAANKRLLHHPVSVLATDKLGNRLLCRADDIVQKHIAVFGCWEPTLTAYLLNHPKTDGIFLDIGANIGYFSVLASHIFSEVVAFEPSPSLYSTLAHNVALNGCKNISLHQVAIADVRSRLRFYKADHANVGRSSLHPKEGFEYEADVDCAPLQDFLTDADWQRVKFIKIDVEGAESAVFSSLMKSHHLLPQDVTITIETNGRQDAHSTEIFTNMRKLGYAAFDLQSTYRLDDYLSNTAPDPQSVAEVPDSYTDCLFRR